MKPYLFFSLLFLLGFAYFGVGRVEAAVLSFEPKAQDIEVGKMFYLEVRLDTENESVNAAEAHIVFPPDKLRVTQLERGGSILTLWPKEPAFDNTKGEASFIGGAIGAFRGKDGLVGRILFEAKTSGNSVSITAGSSSRVIIADGKGTLAKLSLSDVSLAIRAARPNIIFSPSHSDENQWSRVRTPVFRWETQAGTRWSYTLTRDQSEKPDDTPDTPIGEVSFESVGDGIYYFVLKSLSAPQDIFRYRVMIDATPPLTPEIKLSRDPTNTYSFLSFTSEDESSGVKTYVLCRQDGKEELIVEDEARPTGCREAAIPLILEEEDLGAASLILKVIDFAGNESKAIIRIPSSRSLGGVPLLAPFFGVFLLLIVVLLLKAPRARNSLSVLFRGERTQK